MNTAVQAHTMTINSRHLGFTVLIALALHGALVFWLSLPAPAPVAPVTPIKPPVHVNLLSLVAEHTVEAVTPPPEPIPEPPKPIEPKPPEPKPVPKPPEPKPPAPKPLPKPPEPTPAPEPVEKTPEAIIEPIENTAVQMPPLTAVATARYEQLLVAWLEKHKQYPRRAKRMRIQGEAVLRILINHNGQVQRVSLAQATGNRLLDKAALDMAHRADPFPPMADNDPRQQLDFMVPVAFLLR
jgi:periplasmic protein TonB